MASLQRSPRYRRSYRNGAPSWTGILDYMLAGGAVVLPLATIAIGIWRWQVARGNASGSRQTRNV
jgi:hypothetical protein